MSGRRLGVAAAFAGGRIVPGDVTVDHGIVTGIGVPGGRGRGRGLAAPGFVDVQVNGFAGVDFTVADVAGYGDAAAAIARTGVTSFLATIPTTHPDQYAVTLRTAAMAVSTAMPGARIAGVHLEGPFLSPVRPGAHRPDWLLLPDRTLCDRWLEEGPVVLVTLAPELPGALELISHLVARGVTVSVGHTDALGAQAHAGFDAGASMITHLWNAQRPITSRQPAAGGAALARRDVAVAMICDLVHVAADTLLLSIAAAGDRFVMVTDAVAAAGLPDGTYAGRNWVSTVSGGAVRLEDGTLAGSACPMDQAIRNLVGLGLPLERVLAAATSAPADAIGRGAEGLGRLAPGVRADVTVLDDALEITRVLVGGNEV